MFPPTDSAKSAFDLFPTTDNVKDINPPRSLQFECGSKEIVLTLKESQLLELLIKRKGMIVSKENIIVKLWGYDTDAEDNRVEIHVSLLRKKLAQLDSDVYIHTIRGAGYILKTIRDGQ
ncbi:MAG: winged helix-turn-helix transcriptional regulator [Pseudobutyrivibrio ruminis]|jgi:DNA-binding response OmpR family regulator|nr:winged helix-turn-helix transcriptional regulator [Pseudobutyrivibrio ruminis]